MKIGRLARLAPFAPCAVLAWGVAWAVACGGSVDSGTTQHVDGGGADGTSAGPDADGPGDDSDASVTIGDGGPPVCPAKYSVYGDTDPSNNLGHIDPRLWASGTCVVGDAAGPELTMSMTQSASHSGMFVATVHQTDPFPFDLTTCLESSGPNTGSSAGPGHDGGMILTNVPEDQLQRYPNVVLATDFSDTIFLDVYLADASAPHGNVKCTYVKN